MNTIDFIETKQNTRFVVIEDRFQYLPKNGWAWLQRLCFLVLRKLKCNAHDEVLTYTKHTVNTKNVLEAIMREHRDLAATYHQAGERVLIGADDFSRMMSSQEVRGLLSFTVEYGYGREIYGMKITVVPWMRGVLVVPKL